MRCRDCRYWDPEEAKVRYGHSSPEDFAECGLLDSRPLYQDRHNWKRDGEGPPVLVPIPGLENAKAFVQDCSGYKASLHTRGDFGCVEYEERVLDQDQGSSLPESEREV